jgi:hypothetical protein
MYILKSKKNNEYFTKLSKCITGEISFVTKALTLIKKGVKHENLKAVKSQIIPSEKQKQLNFTLAQKINYVTS